MSTLSPPIGFDAAAERYDADESGNQILVHMRARAHEQLCQAFAPGARLVELGSGTGTEAARLVAERDCKVALVDVAPRLLERAADRVRSKRPEGLLGAHLLPAHSVGHLSLLYGRESFDGAYSSFGPLNCEPLLEPVAEGLAELVKPGGELVLSIINRWCPAEVLWFAMHGEWQEAVRRWDGPVRAAAFPGGPKDVVTWYYSRAEIERAFGPWFRTEHVEALPLLWPPPYLNFLVDRFETFFHALEPIEPIVAQWPLLRELGDHVLLRLRRN
jgi:SAM-dependent methyltransferase